MRASTRFAAGLAVWVLLVGGAALGLARDQEQEREALYQRFASRAHTGAEFVGAYAEDVFASQNRLAARLDHYVRHPRMFAERTLLLGFEAAVVLDERGRVVAVAPWSRDSLGADLSDRPHLAAALTGTRTVSDVTLSLVEQKPIVAFAQPLPGPDLRVLSAGYDLAESPLKTLLSRQPVLGTQAYLVDSGRHTIVSSADAMSEPASEALIADALGEPLVTEDSVVSAARVPGTAWIYVVEAPRVSLLAPLSGGGTTWVVLGGCAVLGLLSVISVARVSAARDQARRARAAADNRLRLTVEHAPIGMAMLDLDQRFLEPNAKLCEMLGQSPEELARRRLPDVTHPADVGGDDDMLAQLISGDRSHYELVKRLVGSDGHAIEARTSVSLVRDDDGMPAYFVAQIEDVSSAQAAHAELEHRAHYDSLTGLPNRELLLRRLEAALVGSDASKVALGFCDLDGFKQVNDTDGHHAGDHVLQEVAVRLTNVLREGDTVARMGGDEFVIMLLGVRSDDEVRRVMERALQSVKQPIVVGERQHLLSLSVGVAFASDGDSADRLLANADLALYAAKRAGRDRMEFYSAALRAKTATWGPTRVAERRATPLRRAAPGPEQAALEQSIRYALEHDGVALAYQPVFDLTTNLLVGVEALLRLRDESGAVLSPPHVVQAAEHSGLITDLGWRVLHLATIQCAAWREECGILVPVAVNVSAAQLGATDFAADIQAAVSRVDLPTRAIGIELTETVILNSVWGAQQLQELRDAGFELAIDDFGTGYASLTYLHELPATSLKIDGSFVAGLPDDPRAVAIVAGVVTLARNLGIACVAEGIETEAQRQHLKELGILGQGYLLGRPGDAGAISTLVQAGRMGTPPAVSVSG